MSSQQAKQTAHPSIRLVHADTDAGSPLVGGVGSAMTLIPNAPKGMLPRRDERAIERGRSYELELIIREHLARTAVTLNGKMIRHMGGDFAAIAAFLDVVQRGAKGMGYDQQVEEVNFQLLQLGAQGIGSICTITQDQAGEILRRSLQADEPERSFWRSLLGRDE